MIEHSIVEKIFDAANITEVVQDFVSLKKRGVNYLGLCPFHNEKTPSFTVSPAKGIYKCFGCGKGGNSVNFVMEHEHLSYYEALKHLGKKYNIEIVEKELTAEEVQQKNERESLLIVTRYASKYFSDILFNHDEGISVGLSYFKERGFRTATIEKFELGYSLENRKAFTNAAMKNGYKLDYLVKTGLSIKRDDGSSFDRFSGRVIFPIHSLAGKVIGFGARILKTDKKTAKYLNSPESDIYHKSKVLYGLFQAKKSIVNENKCLLVEGYTDVISLHQNNIENVVASSGTSLTTEQIRLIKRFTDQVTVIYDGDEAGVKASLRGIDIILEEGMKVKIVMLPSGEDPDSYARKLSSSELKEYIAREEKDFIVFKSKLLLKEAENDPMKRATLITDVVRSIAVIPDSITRSVYIRECSTLLHIEEKVLYSEVSRIRRSKAEQQYKQLRRNQQKPAPEQAQPAQPITTENEVFEKEIIRLLLQYGNLELFKIPLGEEEEKSISVAEFIITEITTDDLHLQNPVYKQMYEEIQHGLVNGQPIEDKYFIQHQDANISRTAVEVLTPGYILSKLWAKNENFVETEDMKLKKMVPEVINSYKEKKVRNMFIEIHRKLFKAQENKAFDEIEDIQKQLMDVKSIQLMINKHLGNRTII